MSTHFSMWSAPEKVCFKRMFATDKLTLGIYYPIASYDGDIPNLVGQEKLAEQADLAGFSAIWSRDVPLRDPFFWRCRTYYGSMGLDGLYDLSC